MHVVFRRSVVEVVDMGTDAIHQRRMERIEAFRASQNGCNRAAGVRAEGSNGDVDSFVVAASEGAAEEIDNGTAGFVTHIFGDGFEACGDDPRGEGSGFGHSFQFMKQGDAEGVRSVH